MHHFTAHRLSVHCIAKTSIQLNEHKGSALRGALYHNLRNRFCTMRDRVDECVSCPLHKACPVCTLVSTMGPENRLGRDAARPYTIQPPLETHKTRYAPGEALDFGLTLYGDAVRLFPYLVMAIQGFEESGLGRAVEENGWRRGTCHVREVWADNPLSGRRIAISRADDPMVQMPDIPVTHAQVADWVAGRRFPTGLCVSFLTPTRLTHRKRLVKPGGLAFRVLLGRLLDRLESLAQHFSDTPLALDYRALMAQAEGVRTQRDSTLWVELRSYSTRQRRATPIGGLVGKVTFASEDWLPFLPWLIWGQFTHVGKDAVKGNGWYKVVL